jgi:trehalose 6-phosphate phosphatase
VSSLPTPQTAGGRAALAALLDEPARALLAIDYDGTLAPIVDQPERAVAHPRAASALGALAELVGRVAIVTGRAAADAVRLGALSGIPGLVVLGHYGLERWSDGRVSTPSTHPGVPAARRGAAALVADGPAGLFLEDKGHSVAVHSRRAADPAGALAVIRPRVEQLARDSGLVVTPGRYVLELRPADTDKGTALGALVAESDPTVVVFIGDDVGDLAAVTALRAWDIKGLVVCSDSEESPPQFREQADLVVTGPRGVVEFLESLAKEIVSSPSR